MKTCTKCGVEKELDSFSKNKRAPDGLQYWCEPCMVVSRRESTLQKLYGIGLDQYEQMYEKQAGCCAICNQHADSFKHRLSVDHCHTSGAVRGLLCHNCNTAIGKFNDNIELLEGAISYLRSQNQG